MIKLSRWQNGYCRYYKEPIWNFFDYDLVKRKGKWKLDDTSRWDKPWERIPLPGKYDSYNEFG